MVLTLDGFRETCSAHFHPFRLKSFSVGKFSCVLFTLSFQYCVETKKGMQTNQYGLIDRWMGSKCECELTKMIYRDRCYVSVFQLLIFHEIYSFIYFAQGFHSAGVLSFSVIMCVCVDFVQRNVSYNESIVIWIYSYKITIYRDELCLTI